MLIFWENVLRFPRFFITSFSGLIIILLTPFITFAKKNTITQIVFVCFLTLFLTGLVFIFQEMLNL